MSLLPDRSGFPVWNGAVENGKLYGSGNFGSLAFEIALCRLRKSKTTFEMVCEQLGNMNVKHDLFS